MCLKWKFYYLLIYFNFLDVKNISKFNINISKIKNIDDTIKFILLSNINKINELTIIPFLEKDNTQSDINLLLVLM